MNAPISKLEAAQRIKDLRKSKGLSQEELAKRLNISRPSLAQIELGKRSIDVVELQKFSMILGFSLDDFMASDFNVAYLPAYFHTSNKAHSEERISVPVFQPGKLKNVLLYMLEKCAGKPNVGETVLHKLLYFSDFNYYELYEEHLTGTIYQKLPLGPVPQKIDNVINQMIKVGLIQRVKTQYNHQSLIRYLPLTRARLTELKASEKEIIDRVIEQMSDWSDSVIRQYSQKDMPCLATKDGELINYELAFYREAPFSLRNYDEDIEVE